MSAGNTNSHFVSHALRSDMSFTKIRPISEKSFRRLRLSHDCYVHWHNTSKIIKPKANAWGLTCKELMTLSISKRYNREQAKCRKEPKKWTYSTNSLRPSAYFRIVPAILRKQGKFRLGSKALSRLHVKIAGIQANNSTACTHT